MCARASCGGEAGDRDGRAPRTASPSQLVDHGRRTSQVGWNQSRRPPKPLLEASCGLSRRRVAFFSRLRVAVLAGCGLASCGFTGCG